MKVTKRLELEPTGLRKRVAENVESKRCEFVCDFGVEGELEIVSGLGVDKDEVVYSTKGMRNCVEDGLNL